MRLKTTFLIYPAPSPLQPARLLTPFHSLPCGNLSESTTMNTLRNLCRKSFLQPLRMAPCQYSPDIYRQILRIPKISRPCIPSGRQNTSAQLLTLNVAQKFRFRAGTDIPRRYRPGGTTRKHVADAAKEPPRPSGFCPYPPRHLQNRGTAQAQFFPPSTNRSGMAHISLLPKFAFLSIKTTPVQGVLSPEPFALENAFRPETWFPIAGFTPPSKPYAASILQRLRPHGAVSLRLNPEAGLK